MCMCHYSPLSSPFSSLSFPLSLSSLPLLILYRLMSRLSRNRKRCRVQTGDQWGGVTGGEADEWGGETTTAPAGGKGTCVSSYHTTERFVHKKEE